MTKRNQEKKACVFVHGNLPTSIHELSFGLKKKVLISCSCQMGRTSKLTRAPFL
uniref:ADP-ribosylation factor 1 n=1 Tax=Rhizophora mucronata TaxID=61149 RepID=A0A2P2M1P3_RHIMU